MGKVSDLRVDGTIPGLIRRHFLEGRLGSMSESATMRSCGLLLFAADPNHHRKRSHYTLASVRDEGWDYRADGEST